MDNKYRYLPYNKVELSPGELSSLTSILYNNIEYCCIGDSLEDENDQDAKILYQKFRIWNQDAKSALDALRR